MAYEVYSLLCRNHDHGEMDYKGEGDFECPICGFTYHDDEYDDEEEEIVEERENLFTIDGTAYIEEVNELVGEIIPEGDYDTLGGFIISLLDFLPQDGDMNEVVFENLKFTILDVEERRIGKVRVEITPIEDKDIDN